MRSLSAFVSHQKSPSPIAYIARAEVDLGRPNLALYSIIAGLAIASVCFLLSDWNLILYPHFLNKIRWTKLYAM